MTKKCDEYAEFHDHKKNTHSVPVVLYADMESILGKSNISNSPTGNTDIMCNQRAVSFRIDVCSFVDFRFTNKIHENTT